MTAPAGLDLDALSRRFPRTVATIGQGEAGVSTLRHILHLQEGFGRGSQVQITRDGPGRGADGRGGPQYDVILAGGGLSLLYGAALAQRGVKVAIFDRRRIGCGHREWNISLPELHPLSESGLFTPAEVARLIRVHYRHGICRFAGGGNHAVRGVLDCVVDAEALLVALRQRAEQAGATLLDHHELAAYRTGPAGVTVVLRAVGPDGAPRPGAERELSGRVLLDGMGAHSPHARFDLCCPTVGGVLGGLLQGSAPDQFDPEVGEILVTTEGLVDGRQHIWEGFPSDRDGHMTVYLFYYCEPAALPEDPLLSLYERFFETLPAYKRGPAQLVRPTYGYIPAYSRLRPMPVAPRDRVLLVGDAASRHSPLTFCGFGSMVRSFWPMVQGLCQLLARDRLARRDLSGIWPDDRALRVMGALTLMMSPREGGPWLKGDPDGLNRLLDAAFAEVAEMGESIYAAFLQDRISFADFVRFTTGTARRQPDIYRKVWQQLRPGEIAAWMARMMELRLHAASAEPVGRDTHDSAGVVAVREGVC